VLSPRLTCRRVQQMQAEMVSLRSTVMRYLQTSFLQTKARHERETRHRLLENASVSAGCRSGASRQSWGLLLAVLNITPQICDRSCNAEERQSRHATPLCSYPRRPSHPVADVVVTHPLILPCRARRRWRLTPCSQSGPRSRTPRS
jgi:hypothetical protein